MTHSALPTAAVVQRKQLQNELSQLDRMRGWVGEMSAVYMLLTALFDFHGILWQRGVTVRRKEWGFLCENCKKLLGICGALLVYLGVEIELSS